METFHSSICTSQDINSNTTGVLVYGAGGLSATQIQPQPHYSLSSPSREISPGYAIPEMASGACPVKLITYVFAEPAAGVVNVNRPSSRLGFDVKAYAKSAGLGEPIGSNFFTVNNGKALMTCIR